MKTITILLAAFFTLQISALFAGNESNTFRSEPVELSLDITSIMPVTPLEATFEEITNEVNDPGSIAPVTPAEAEFEEMVPEIDFAKLAPVTPRVADFQ